MGLAGVSLMRPLVVVADDAGLSPASDATILRCHREGIVRAASVVSCGPSAERFLQRAREVGLEVGLHLNLTEGPCRVGEIEGLARRGVFLGDKRRTWRRLAELRELPAGLLEEIGFQIEWLMSRAGTFTFVNGHNHVHVFPVVAQALATLLPERACFVRDPGAARDRARLVGFPWTRVLGGADLRARFPRAVVPQAFSGLAFSGTPTLEEALASWTDRDGEQGEWMVHPGVRPGSSFTDNPVRAQEVGVLCDPRLEEGLMQLGWRPVGYAELH